MGIEDVQTFIFRGGGGGGACLQTRPYPGRLCFGLKHR